MNHIDKSSVKIFRNLAIESYSNVSPVVSPSPLPIVFFFAF